jgi:hypothetical protein
MHLHAKSMELYNLLVSCIRAILFVQAVTYMCDSLIRHSYQSNTGFVDVSCSQNLHVSVANFR